MISPFEAVVTELRIAQHHVDANSASRQQALLTHLCTMPLRETPALLQYYEVLLFMSAYPATSDLLTVVDAELLRLQRYLRARRGRHATASMNTGLPYVSITMQFSHDCTRWLLQQPDCRVTLDAFEDETLDLNAVLRLTLPLMERPHTTAELSNNELLDLLNIRPARRLEVIIAELSRLDERPYVKDHLYDALGVQLCVTPTTARFSLAGNRLPMARTFLHAAPAEAFDARTLMNSALPPARTLNANDRDTVTCVVRTAMVLTSRETDPTTYLDAESLRVFDLERGVSVAVYGMTPDRQLGLESYVGFTAFKNGLPVAYGGAWVLGQRSEFGMNIFEPYRGGESGFLMCQLLRVYRQLFGVSYFEVDAHQFGLDNPDGINSGAFWFYYKYGFRPVSAKLATLARREKARLKTRRGLRTPKPMLRQFTTSNVALRFNDALPPALSSVTTRITRMIGQSYSGNRVTAEEECVRKFENLVSLPRRMNAAERRVLVDVALMAAALNVADRTRLQLLATMVNVKPKDLYGYQQLVTEFFAQPATVSPP
jgi:hypothetical protein